MTYLPPIVPGPRLKIDMGRNMPSLPEGSSVFGLTPEIRRETRWADIRALKLMIQEKSPVEKEPKGEEQQKVQEQGKVAPAKPAKQWVKSEGKVSK